MHSIKSIRSFQMRNQITMNKRIDSIKYIAITLMVSVCIILISTFKIQMANAHSLIDNSIHGSENGHQNHLANKNQSNRMMQANQNVNQNRCQSGWMWFNNKCWVTTQSRRDFAHAMELCRKMHNSTLPTIHSEDENEFLRQNILSILHNSPIWLYARHNHQYNQTRWLDKSDVNYTRWDAGQPSDKSSLVCIKTEESWYMKKAERTDGQTECVSFWEDAKWGTQVGCLVLLPVVCERKLPPIGRRYSDSTQENTILSQSEQQQMFSGASSSFSGYIWMYSIFSFLSMLAIMTINPPLNQNVFPASISSKNSKI